MVVPACDEDGHCYYYYYYCFLPWKTIKAALKLQSSKMLNMTALKDKEQVRFDALNTSMI